MKNIQHIVVLILLGVGAVLSVLKRVDLGLACVAAALFLEEL